MHFQSLQIKKKLKFSKSKKKYAKWKKFESNNVIEPNDDVITFGTKLLKNIGGNGNLPLCKKSSF